jgi:hypothetical protein
VNALIEFAALWRCQPLPDAPDEVVAAWYQAKGRLHEALAAAGGPDAAAELAYAAAAYEHARRLLTRPAAPAGAASSAAVPLPRSPHQAAAPVAESADRVVLVGA